MHFSKKMIVTAGWFFATVFEDLSFAYSVAWAAVVHRPAVSLRLVAMSALRVPV